MVASAITPAPWFSADGAIDCSGRGISDASPDSERGVTTRMSGVAGAGAGARARSGSAAVSAGTTLDCHSASNTSHSASSRTLARGDTGGNLPEVGVRCGQVAYAVSAVRQRRQLSASWEREKAQLATVAAQIGRRIAEEQRAVLEVAQRMEARAAAERQLKN